MALKGTKKGTVTLNSSKFEYWLEWSATQSIADNTSTITVKHYWKSASSTDFDSVGTRRYGITIDGKAFTGTKRMDYDPWTDKNISTATHTVTHNADGTKSVTISTYANGRASSYGPSSSSDSAGDCTASVTITLDQIPRAAKLLTATNFTDETNPTITYENPAGSAADVQVGILNTAGTTSYAAYRSISKTGTSYTFSLTDAEKTALRNAVPDGTNEMYVNIYIKTYINGTLVENPRYLTRIFSVVNSEPTISYTLKDTGSASTALTKDNTVMIKGFNYVNAVMTPTYKKGATAKTQTITNGSTVVSGTSTNFNNAENNKFIFKVTDSYGNEVSKEATMTMVDYVKLTCNVSVNAPTANQLSAKVHGNFFNNTFGSNGVKNTLTLKWRIKTNDGSYGSWTTVTPTLSGNTYSYTITKALSGEEYKNTYTIQAIAIDAINTSGVLSPERVTKSEPVFNWGKNNFDINVPLNVDGQIDATGLSTAIFNLIYPVGSIYMSMNATNPGTIFGGTWEQITGRFLLGTTNTPGTTGGESTVTLTSDQMPNHGHTVSATYSGANFYIRHGKSEGTDMVKAGTNVTVEEGVGETWGTGVSTETYSHKIDKITIKGTVNPTIGNTGGGKAHNNMPPYVHVYIWKRTA